MMKINNGFLQKVTKMILFSSLNSINSMKKIKPSFLINIPSNKFSQSQQINFYSEKSSLNQSNLSSIITIGNLKLYIIYNLY